MITTLREVMIANVRLNMFPQDEKGGNLISAATCSHAIMPSCGPCPRYRSQIYNLVLIGTTIGVLVVGCVSKSPDF